MRSNLRFYTTEKMNEALTSMAKNLGETKASFLRPIIREIASQFPEDLKKEKPVIKKQMTITGVPDSVLKELNLIAENLGVDPNDLLKIELDKIIRNQSRAITKNYTSS